MVNADTPMHDVLTSAAERANDEGNGTALEPSGEEENDRVNLAALAQTMGTEIQVYHGATDSLMEELTSKSEKLSAQISNLDTDIAALTDKRGNHILALEIVEATLKMIRNKVR